MSKVCQLTGKRPMSGNNVSHANNKTRRRFLPNLQACRLWDEENSRYTEKMRLSTRALRTINKLIAQGSSLNQALAKIRKTNKTTAETA